jgi:hypothetical protein
MVFESTMRSSNSLTATGDRGAEGGGGGETVGGDAVGATAVTRRLNRTEPGSAASVPDTRASLRNVLRSIVDRSIRVAEPSSTAHG